MRFFLCWICPPLAVLSCRRPFSAMLNFVLTCFFWYPGVRHAYAIVENYYADQRNKKLLRAIDHPMWAQHVFAAPEPKKMKLPKGRKAKELVESQPEVYNDPHIGESGTVFRRRIR